MFRNRSLGTATGAVRTKGTYQGYSNESAWSRGQAWAICGFTVAYRETGNDDFLSAARRAADFYIARLADDFVPYWDFRAPNIPKIQKDSAAAAIAASALLEPGALLPDERVRARYRDIAKRTLQGRSPRPTISRSAASQAGYCVTASAIVRRETRWMSR